MKIEKTKKIVMEGEELINILEKHFNIEMEDATLIIPDRFETIPFPITKLAIKMMVFQFQGKKKDSICKKVESINGKNKMLYGQSILHSNILKGIFGLNVKPADEKDFIRELREVNKKYKKLQIKHRKAAKIISELKQELEDTHNFYKKLRLKNLRLEKEVDENKYQAFRINSGNECPPWIPIDKNGEDIPENPIGKMIDAYNVNINSRICDSIDEGIAYLIDVNSGELIKAEPEVKEIDEIYAFINFKLEEFFLENRTLKPNAIFVDEKSYDLIREDYATKDIIKEIVNLDHLFYEGIEIFSHTELKPKEVKIGYIGD
jgi:hypothetical protein